MLFLRVAAGLFFVFLATLGFSSDCLSYEPAVVTLRGTLVRKTFPGPPNYEDIRKGDRAEVFWLLDLDSPICVNEGKSEPGLNPEAKNIRRVQLVVEAETYKRYKGLVGKKVIATGTLFEGFNGHHHTPVLLMVMTLK
jgi:hypothetical protein